MKPVTRIMRRADEGCPSPSDLSELLSYNPDTGLLHWKWRDEKWFSDKGRSASGNQSLWNAKNAGRRAFTSVSASGYLHGTIFHKGYMAHRVAWAVFHGYWPDDCIDHINGIRTDNRIENLRDVGRDENAKNQRLHKTNTSGVTGVSYRSDNGLWRARIRIDRKMRTIGMFASFEDAVSCRKDAEIALNYHENHGASR